MISPTSASVLQILMSLVRPFVYAIGVSRLSSDKSATGLLVLVGYIPLFAVLDSLVQALSRWRYLRSPYDASNGSSVMRAMFGGGTIAVFAFSVGVAAFADSKAWFVAGMVVLYALNSVGFLWERDSAALWRWFFAAACELSLSSACVASTAIAPAATWIVVVQLSLFPVSRLIALALPFRTESPSSTKGRQRSVSGWSFVAYSVGQHGLAASAASLPAIGAQMTGDYSSLGASLISFRFMHSAAAAASLVVNLLGARIFYGVAGRRWQTLEVWLAGSLTKWFRFGGVFLFAAAVLPLFVTDRESAGVVAAVCAVPVLIMCNLLSSLCMSRGLPRLTFVCQAVVLAISGAVCLRMLGYSSVAVAAWGGAVLGVVVLGRTVLGEYRSYVAGTVSGGAV